MSEENEKVCPLIVTMAAKTAPSDAYRPCIGSDCMFYDSTGESCKLLEACDALIAADNE